MTLEQNHATRRNLMSCTELLDELLDEDFLPSDLWHKLNDAHHNMMDVLDDVTNMAESSDVPSWADSIFIDDDDIII